LGGFGRRSSSLTSYDAVALANWTAIAVQRVKSLRSLYITDPVFSNPTAPSSEAVPQELHPLIDLVESPACSVLGMQSSLQLPIAYLYAPGWVLVFLDPPRHACVNMGMRMDANLCSCLFLLKHLDHQRSTSKDISFLVYLRTSSARSRFD